MTTICSHICLYDICDMCICSPINIYKQISNTSMYVFFSYNITGDLLHRVPLTQVLFLQGKFRALDYISQKVLSSQTF